MNKENITQTVEEAAAAIMNAINEVANVALEAHGQGDPEAWDNVEELQQATIKKIIQSQRQAAVEEYKASLWKPIETMPEGVPAWYVTAYDMPGALRLGVWDNGIHKSSHWLPLALPESIINQAKGE